MLSLRPVNPRKVLRCRPTPSHAADGGGRGPNAHGPVAERSVFEPPQNTWTSAANRAGEVVAARDARGVRYAEDRHRGARCGAGVASPSCPAALSPQHTRRDSVRTAHVWVPLAEMLWASVSVARGLSALVGPVSPAHTITARSGVTEMNCSRPAHRGHTSASTCHARCSSVAQSIRDFTVCSRGPSSLVPSPSTRVRPGRASLVSMGSFDACS